MKTISILNQKGGVGKTTTTFNIATILANKGYKVLMIDHDGQASLTLACGFNPIEMEFNMSDVYSDKTDLLNMIIKTDIKNLDLASSHINLTSIETSLINELSRETILKRTLEKLENEYDYVLIDNPPHLGLLTINSLVASEYVLIPCSTNPLATYALPDLLDTIDEVKVINKELKVLGIVATMYNKATKIDNNELEYMKRNYNIVGIIKRSIDASKGLENGLSAYTINPKSDVSKQYFECTENILKEMKGGN